MEIQIERHPTSDKLEKLGVFNWSIWTKEVSEFPWSYDQTETCYFLAGEVTVTPKNGIPIKMAKGDLVTFPLGLFCTW
ncbi:cupin domain-containing protein, partial [Merismopedia glauca]